MFCGKCGQEMSERAKFCPHCGEPNPRADQAPKFTAKVPNIPRPAAGGSAQLAENPLQLGLAGCAFLQVVLFFVLSYGKLTSMGRLGYAMFDYDGSGRMTLPTAARLVMISGKVGGNSGEAFLDAFIFYLPLLLGLAVLALNLLCMMKLIAEKPFFPVLSTVLSAVTLAAHLLSRLMLTGALANRAWPNSAWSASFSFCW